MARSTVDAVTRPGSVTTWRYTRASSPSPPPHTCWPPCCSGLRVRSEGSSRCKFAGETWPTRITALPLEHERAIDGGNDEQPRCDREAVWLSGAWYPAPAGRGCPPLAET